VSDRIVNNEYDIAPNDTIVVNLDLYADLAFALEQYDDYRKQSTGLSAAFVVDAARRLIADTAGDTVTP
jgi:hypothetical protein